MKFSTSRTQLGHFWQSEVSGAAANHERMAEMQRAAGNDRLAADSERTASARRIAAANLAPDAGDLSEALSFGTWGAEQAGALPSFLNKQEA